MKVKVPLAIKCFDAIHYKLLHNNIDKLMAGIRNYCLNTSLWNISELGFNQKSILKMFIITKDSKSLSAVSCTTPLQEVFHMNSTDDDKNLAYSNATIDFLQKVLMMVSFTKKKLYLTTWTNGVFCKFLLINIKSPDILHCHVLDGTLSPKLQANNFLSMNNNTL